MLRLLAQGEQGYADIAALMGLGEDDVRAKVVGALAQLQAEGKPAPDVPPPIAGGAKPAAEVPPPGPDPAPEAAPPIGGRTRPAGEGTRRAPEPVPEAPAAGEEPEAEPAIADSVAPKE